MTKIRCHVSIPEREIVQMAQEGMLIQFRKMFDGHAFGDFVDLAELVVRYERNLQAARSAARHQSLFSQNEEPFHF